MSRRVTLSHLRNSLRDETGAVAVIVALFLVVLLAMAALVINLGTSYDHDRELQAAADAGALAGAQQLIYDPGQAASVTQDYVAHNTSPNDSASSVVQGNVTFNSLDVGERSVYVNLLESHVPFTFANVLGASEGTVNAQAKAELMYLTGIPAVSPVTIPYLDPKNFTVHVGRSTNREVGTFDLNKTGSGLYSGSTGQTLWAGYSDDYLLWLTAQDDNGGDLMAPLVVGSVFVPSSHSIIRRVELSRPDAGNPSESVTVHVYTEGLPDQVDVLPIVWSVNSGSRHRMSLGNDGNGVFSGSFSVSPSYNNGIAMVNIDTSYSWEWSNWGGTWWNHWSDWWGTGGWSWFGDEPLAMFAMFDQNQSIRYFKQTGYTAGDPAQPTMSATVGTRVYDLAGGEITISSKDLFFQNSFGPTGWGDMLAGAGFGDEVKVALGEEQPDPSWTLNCDTNGNAQADIGEWVPIDANVRAGGWGGGLAQAQGKVLFVALVDPGYEAATPGQDLHSHYSWWSGFFSSWWGQNWHSHHNSHPSTPNYPDEVQITHLGALQVDGVSVDGSDFTLTGHFVRYLSTGTWTSVKPDGLYVETAVLTQ